MWATFQSMKQKFTQLILDQTVVGQDPGEELHDLTQKLSSDPDDGWGQEPEIPVSATSHGTTKRGGPRRNRKEPWQRCLRIDPADRRGLLEFLLHSTEDAWKVMTALEALFTKTDDKIKLQSLLLQLSGPSMDMNHDAPLRLHGFYLFAHRIDHDVNISRLLPAGLTYICRVWETGAALGFLYGAEGRRLIAESLKVDSDTILLLPLLCDQKPADWSTSARGTSESVKNVPRTTARLLSELTSHAQAAHVGDSTNVWMLEVGSTLISTSTGPQTLVLPKLGDNDSRLQTHICPGFQTHLHSAAGLKLLQQTVPDIDVPIHAERICNDHDDPSSGGNLFLLLQQVKRLGAHPLTLQQQLNLCCLVPSVVITRPPQQVPVPAPVPVPVPVAPPTSAPAAPSSVLSPEDQAILKRQQESLKRKERRHKKAALAAAQGQSAGSRQDNRAMSVRSVLLSSIAKISNTSIAMASELENDAIFESVALLWQSNEEFISAKIRGDSDHGTAQASRVTGKRAMPHSPQDPGTRGRFLPSRAATISYTALPAAPACTVTTHASDSSPSLYHLWRRYIVNTTDSCFWLHSAPSEDVFIMRDCAFAAKTTAAEARGFPFTVKRFVVCRLRYFGKPAITSVSVLCECDVFKTHTKSQSEASLSHLYSAALIPDTQPTARTQSCPHAMLLSEHLRWIMLYRVGDQDSGSDATRDSEPESSFVKHLKNQLGTSMCTKYCTQLTSRDCPWPPTAMIKLATVVPSEAALGLLQDGGSTDSDVSHQVSVSILNLHVKDGVCLFTCSSQICRHASRKLHRHEVGSEGFQLCLCSIRTLKGISAQAAAAELPMGRATAGAGGRSTSSSHDERSSSRRQPLPVDVSPAVLTNVLVPLLQSLPQFVSARNGAQQHPGPNAAEPEADIESPAGVFDTQALTWSYPAYFQELPGSNLKLKDLASRKHHASDCSLQARAYPEYAQRQTEFLHWTELRHRIVEQARNADRDRDRDNEKGGVSDVCLGQLTAAKGAGRGAIGFFSPTGQFDLIPPIEPETCRCGAGWTSEKYPDGILVSDGVIIQYGITGAVIRELFRRVCVRYHSPTPTQVGITQASNSTRSSTQQAAVGGPNELGVEPPRPATGSSNGGWMAEQFVVRQLWASRTTVKTKYFTMSLYMDNSGNNTNRPRQSAPATAEYALAALCNAHLLLETFGTAGWGVRVYVDTSVPTWVWAAFHHIGAEVDIEAYEWMKQQNPNVKGSHLKLARFAAMGIDLDCKLACIVSMDCHDEISISKLTGYIRELENDFLTGGKRLRVCCPGGRDKPAGGILGLTHEATKAMRQHLQLKLPTLDSMVYGEDEEFLSTFLESNKAMVSSVMRSELFDAHGGTNIIKLTQTFAKCCPENSDARVLYDAAMSTDTPPSQTPGSTPTMWPEPLCKIGLGTAPFYGVPNLGVSCWLGSMLTCWAACPSMATLCIDMPPLEISEWISGNPGHKVHAARCMVLLKLSIRCILLGPKGLHGIQIPQDSRVSIHARTIWKTVFKRLVSDLAQCLQMHRQEDPDEGLCKISSLAHTASTEEGCVFATKLSSLILFDATSHVVCNSCRRRVKVAEGDEKLLHGHLPCASNSKSFELKQLVQWRFEQGLPERYGCEHCCPKGKNTPINKRVPATKIREYCNPPPILMLPVSRMVYKDSLVTANTQALVKFEMNLKFCDAQYVLVAVTTHVRDERDSETSSRGHYVSLLRLPSGQWVFQNDDKPSEVISDATVLSSDIGRNVRHLWYHKTTWSASCSRPYVKCPSLLPPVRWQDAATVVFDCDGDTEQGSGGLAVPQETDAAAAATTPRPATTPGLATTPTETESLFCEATYGLQDEYVFRATRHIAIAFEVGTLFDSKATTGNGETFGSFCDGMNVLYKLCYGSSGRIMFPGRPVFTRWWFAWASRNADVDWHRVDCEPNPRKVCMDGVSLGPYLRNVPSNFHPFHLPKPGAEEIQVDLRRHDRCFIISPRSVGGTPRVTVSIAAEAARKSLAARVHLMHLSGLVTGQEKKKLDYNYEEQADSMVRCVGLDLDCSDHDGLTCQKLLRDWIGAFAASVTSLGPAQIMGPGSHLFAQAKLCRQLASENSLDTIFPLQHHATVKAFISCAEENDFIGAMGHLSMFGLFAPQMRALLEDIFSWDTTIPNQREKMDQELNLVRYIQRRVATVAAQFAITHKVPEPGEFTYNPAVSGFSSTRGKIFREMRSFSIDHDNSKKPDSAGIARGPNAIEEAGTQFLPCCTKKYSVVGKHGNCTTFTSHCVNHDHFRAFHFIAGSEGRRDALAHIYRGYEKFPSFRFYDFACGSCEFEHNREPCLAANTQYFHDIFHGYKHLCSSAHKVIGHDGHHGINTSIAEQTNAYLKLFKKTLAALHMQESVFFLEYFGAKWNHDKDANRVLKQPFIENVLNL